MLQLRATKTRVVVLLSILARYPGSVTHNAPHIGTVEWHIRWSLALP